MARSPKKLSSLATIGTFLKTGTCSEAICNRVDRAFGHQFLLEERAASPLAGGILQHGYQCGALWGAVLAAGARAYQLYGSGPKSETAALIAAQKLVEIMLGKYKEINCAELTDTNWKKPASIFKYFIKGGTIKCFSMVAGYADLAFKKIKAVFSKNDFKVPTTPVSCAALVASKMGATDRQISMAAGFAGGIGLSGSACGALGAAVWLAAMGILQKPSGKIGLSNPETEAVVNRYMTCSDYEFECADLVGRKFKDAADHADYLKNGGCADIIDCLATEIGK